MNHKDLETPVLDLLSELRIGPTELHLMAHGLSPDYPGVLPEVKSTQPKVQISAKTASKLWENLPDTVRNMSHFQEAIYKKKEKK